MYSCIGHQKTMQKDIKDKSNEYKCLLGCVKIKFLHIYLIKLLMDL